MCTICQCLKKNSWQVSDHIVQYHEEILDLLPRCNQCSSKKPMTPQHYVNHLKLHPIFTCPDATFSLFAVPLTDKSGRIVDVYVGYTKTNRDQTMTDKMSKIANDARSACTGLYNSTKRVCKEKQVTPHTFAAIDLGVYCVNDDEAMCIKGMLRWMGQSDSGHHNTMNSNLTHMEPLLIERLKVLKSLIAPLKDIRHFAVENSVQDSVI